MNNRFKKLELKEPFQMTEKRIKGHVIVKDASNGKIVLEKDNLVVMRTRVFVFEHLFKVSPPEFYESIDDKERSICLFKVGQGGADVNATPFNPFVPKFSDTDLSQPVPFVIIDPDADISVDKESNPSIITELTDEQSKIYYLPKENPDGTLSYYAKIFEPESQGWVIDSNTGEVAYSLSMRIEPYECRGFIINEIGTILAKYNESENIYEGAELATRITFDSESLANLTKGIEIEYVFYI